MCAVCFVENIPGVAAAFSCWWWAHADIVASDWVLVMGKYTAADVLREVRRFVV
jgi:hypothetical protein